MQRPRDVQTAVRAGPLLAVVLLLAACAGAPQSSPSLIPLPTPGSATPAATGPAPASPGLSPAPTGAPTAPAGAWRELLSGAALGDEFFTVAAATDREQLDRLWQDLAQAAPAPDVDFEQELVLFFGTGGSSTCPERLEGLVVDFGAATVHGRWAEHEPGVPCTDDIQAQGVLIAVSRGDVPDVPFQLSLKAEPVCPECPDRPDQTVVDPAG